jgi:hypothetical protein
MSLVDLIPAPYRVVALLGAVVSVAGVSAAATWQVQEWRYSAQLDRQALEHGTALRKIELDAEALQLTEDKKRDDLQRRSQLNDTAHHSELTHAQKTQARLRDRLATSDLRLSVLLAAADPRSGAVPPTTGPTGLVHGAGRARLDPAHAQRIVGITDDGDRGLIALRACQGWVSAFVK